MEKKETCNWYMVLERLGYVKQHGQCIDYTYMKRLKECPICGKEISFPNVF